MTIKNSFIKILTNAFKRSTETREEILRICGDGNLTEEGKRNSVEKMQKELRDYILSEKAKVTEIVSDRVKNLDAYEAAVLKEKNTDVKYQSLLSNTLQILPVAVKRADPQDLKERLKMFSDDPVAISAIKETLESSMNGHERLAYMGVIPTDSRGQKRKTIAKLSETMINLLDGMNISVQDRAYAENVDLNLYTVSSPAPINATIDYINACDEDCTVYDREKHYTSIQSEEPSTAFNFGFNRLR